MTEEEMRSLRKSISEQINNRLKILENNINEKLNCQHTMINHIHAALNSERKAVSFLTEKFIELTIRENSLDKC